MTPVRFSPSSLRQSRWHEYPVRFALGGLATVVTGLISDRYGGAIGGLFLAFPVIFGASVTLIEKHEIERKRDAGVAGRRRGQMAAALDAAGVALGAFGLLAFAVVFSFVVKTSIPGAFVSASLAWFIVAMAAWYGRRKLRFPKKRRIA
jgi:Protein of unknown function (DUF3147)